MAVVLVCDLWNISTFGCFETGGLSVESTHWPHFITSTHRVVVLANDCGDLSVCVYLLITVWLSVRLCLLALNSDKVVSL